MARKQTFKITVIYDEDEIYAGNALDAVEHEMFNVDGIYEWDSIEISDEDVEYDDEDNEE